MIGEQLVIVVAQIDVLEHDFLDLEEALVGQQSIIVVAEIDVVGPVGPIVC